MDPEKDEEMIRVWRHSVDVASQSAPQFKLQPGQVLIADNYRLMHGRAAYEDLQRMLWRVWIWTDECLRVPDLPLASDTRFAAARG